MQGTFSIVKTYESLIDKLEAWKAFCTEHGFVATYNIDKRSGINFSREDYFDVSYECQGLSFVGNYNYSTHSYSGDELSADELEFVQHSTFCAICNSSRARLVMSVVRINGSLATIGLDCLKSLSCKTYFSKSEILDDIVETRQEALSHYQYSITDMLRFVNQYTKAYASYTHCRDYTNAAVYCKCAAHEFFKAINTLSIEAEHVESIDQLIDELESINRNEFQESIYLMLKDAKSMNDMFHDKSVAKMLSYLFNRKANNICKDAAAAELITEKATSMKLVYAAFMPSKYDFDGKIKYVFKTANNMLVVWYATSFAYANDIGKTFTANLSKAEIKTDYCGCSMLLAKRLRLK